MKDCPVKFCTNCKRSGHVYINCPNLQCSNCSQIGHSKYGCPNLRNVMNKEAKESSQDLLVRNDGNALYAWKDKTGEVHDTKEPNWKANWPPCVSCQKPAFISTHATKAKCLYYYRVKPDPNTNICGECLA